MKDYRPVKHRLAWDQGMYVYWTWDQSKAHQTLKVWVCLQIKSWHAWA